MANRNISSYYVNNSNQHIRYMSCRLTNYNTSGSSESYRITYYGFDISVNMVRILSTGNMQRNFTLNNVSSERAYNRMIHTSRSNAYSFITREITFELNTDYQYINSYQMTTASYEAPIELDWIFYDYKEMNAYEIGYTQGMDDTEAIYSDYNPEFSGTFTLIGQAFTSMGGILNTQVIGGLTIGALVGIPLTITIVITLFRMLRK